MSLPKITGTKSSSRKSTLALDEELLVPDQEGERVPDLAGVAADPPTVLVKQAQQLLPLEKARGGGALEVAGDHVGAAVFPQPFDEGNRERELGPASAHLGDPAGRGPPERHLGGVVVHLVLGGDRLSELEDLHVEQWHAKLE